MRPLFFILFFLLSLGSQARAAGSSSPIHHSSDHTVWDRRTNQIELNGHAVVVQVGETLTADHIHLDMESRILDAKGHCIYTAEQAIIYGEEMHFNMDTRTGTIIAGRVTSDRFTLSGERINKLSAGRFQTHRGDYSTCHDCPQSWTLHGDDVDLQFEGYAFLKDVTAKIEDTSIFWLPYLIVPIKTRRQTGFLFPKFSFTSEGFRFVQPFFWAINRSADMTIGGGDYGGHGARLEWQGRYKLSQRSGGEAEIFYLHDTSFEKFLDVKKFRRSTSHRWAVNVAQTQELPYNIDEKFRLLDVSDNYYPSRLGDVPGNGEAFISSDLIFSHATSQVSTYFAGKRSRNLLTKDPLEYDQRTVQVYPTAVTTTNDRFLLNTPIAAGVTLGVTNFTRTYDPVDINPLAGPPIDPSNICTVTDPASPRCILRKATRVSITPSIYTTLRPWDVFSVVPSLEYRSNFYSFHNVQPNLSRGYLLFRTDLSTQIEKIYETSNPDIPKVKHLIRPILTYNLIPYIQQDDSHPFLRQIAYAQRNQFSGFNFDDADIVPLDTSRTYNTYFIPLGHSLTYGFNTQLIRRRGRVDSPAPVYQNMVELFATQSFNFRELKKAQDAEPLSILSSGLRLNFDHWYGFVDYSLVPYVPVSDTNSRHVVTLGVNYSFNKELHQKILLFERSLSFAYTYNTLVNVTPTKNILLAGTYSLNDYIQPSTSLSYSLLNYKMLSSFAGLRFQSPSRCWKFDAGFTRRVCQAEKLEDSEYCNTFTVDLSLNLTGTGFGGVGEVASTVISQ